MITHEILDSTPKDKLPELLPTINQSDIDLLILWLNEKDDSFRYKSFLLLQSISEQSSAVYPYWDTLFEKLNNPNSYRRSLGLMLLAENARWDTEKKLDQCIEIYLNAVDDEKPITVRQCIQGLAKIAAARPAYHQVILTRLLGIDLNRRKETQRKVLLLDILGVLAVVRRTISDDRIASYLQNALTGGLLDAKTKKEVRSWFD